MAGALTGAPRADRRSARRFVPGGPGTPVTCRLRPGSQVTVINVSSTGALVEGPCRLRPGGTVSVSFGLAVGGQAMKCVVTRCRVTAVGGTEGVRYQAGLAFETPLAMTGASCARG